MTPREEPNTILRENLKFMKKISQIVSDEMKTTLAQQILTFIFYAIKDTISHCVHA